MTELQMNYDIRNFGKDLEKKRKTKQYEDIPEGRCKQEQ